MSDTDRIEKKIFIRAPRAKVWRALATPEELGKWFGVRIASGQFEPGAEVVGKVTHPGYEHVEWKVTVERVEAEKLLSWHWHPYAVDPEIDYSTEPPTLVEFTLADADEGTMLTVVESGFDRVPASRRSEALRMNDQGWNAQVGNVARHVLEAL